MHLVCPDEGNFAIEAKRLGLNAHPMRMRGSGYIRTIRYVRRLVRESKVDLIHSHLTRATYVGFLAASMTKRPCIASVHVATHDQIYKRLARKRNRLIAVSNFVRGVLHGRGIPERFIDVVYNGTDFADISYAPSGSLHDEFRIPDSRDLVGLVGRVCREKGHLLAIDALPMVLKHKPNAHLMFVGRIEPGFEAEVHDAVAENGVKDNVTFTGNRHDVARMFDGMEYSILPSQMEACPLVALESMARSKAIVASRVGGLSELIEHQETGLLIDQDPAALAEAMTFLLDHEHERNRMGSNAKRMVEERYSLSQMVERVEAVYARSLS